MNTRHFLELRHPQRAKKNNFLEYAKCDPMLAYTQTFSAFLSFDNQSKISTAREQKKNGSNQKNQQAKRM